MVTDINNNKSTTTKLLMAVLLMIFASSFNSATTSLVTVPIINSLGINSSHIRWLFSIYFLVTVCLVVLSGRLSDVYGKVRLLTIGLTLVIVSNFLFFIGTNFWVLFTSRVLLAIGNAFTVPVALALLKTIGDHDFQLRAFSFWGSTKSLARSVGPLIAGFLVSISSWHWPYLLNVALCLIALLLIRMSRDLPVQTFEQKYLDLKGAFLLGLSMSCAVYFFDNVQTWHLPSLEPIVIILVSAVSIILFFFEEKRTQNPLIHLELFKNRIFTTALLVSACNYLFFFGLVLVLNLYAQNAFTFALTPLHMGFVLLFLGIPAVFSSLLTSFLVKRYGPRSTILLGISFIFCGTLHLLYLGDLRSTYLGAISLLIMGFGSGFLSAPIKEAAMAYVPLNYVGEASGMLSMFRFLGGMTSAVLSTFVYFSTTRHHLTKLLEKHFSLAETERLEALVVGHKHVGAEIMGSVDKAFQSEFAKDLKLSFTEGFEDFLLLLLAIALFTAIISFFGFTKPKEVNDT